MIRAVVARGHGVASGSAGDPRFPGGTLALQFPIFAARGLDLRGIHTGTLNLDISPARYEILQSKLTLTKIQWHPDCPPEDFSFFDCEIAVIGGKAPISALIYYPHPETKPEHFQAASILEVLAPKLPDLHYGQVIEITPAPEQLRLLLP